MSLASNIHELLMGGSSSGYSIANSLRFRSSASAYLSRTPASAGNRQTWTWSGWVKRGTLGAYQAIFQAGDGASSVYTVCWFNNSDQIALLQDNGSGGVLTVTTSAVFRDPSAWYHIVIVVDTTQATSNNRTIFYVNGINQSLTYTLQLAQNATTWINSTTYPFRIGSRTNGASFIDGYMAEINFIDGLALDASYFGATNTTTGTWAPKRYSGTYGTNGFYLPFSDTSGLTSGSNTGLGKDFSGNGNYFNSTNISLTAGSTYDAMLDSPTPNSTTVGNYCVLNPLTPVVGNAPINANLTESSSSATAYSSARSTFGLSSGKWYWEQTIDTLTSTNAGVCQIDGGVCLATYNLGAGMSGTGVWGFQNSNGSGTNSWKFDNGNTTNTYTVIGSGDVVGLALDMDAGTLGVYRNNTLLFTCNTSLSGKVVFPFNTVYTATGQTATASMNFGQRPFTYTPPTGYSRVQTYNLPTPAIKKGNQHFDVSLYTGNGSTQSITNSGFQPDLVWYKDRSNARDHGLFDVIRGATNYLGSNLTNAESTVSGVTSFNSNGFSLGSSVNGNGSTETYIAWQWKAGGTAVTNTAGSITSSVSANPTAGFSVVTFTSPASGSASVGHGLGVTPAMFVIKSRSPSASAWAFWHTSLASTTDSYLNLNNTNAVATFAGIWGSGPNSSVFGIGTGAYVASNTYVAYCWAAIPGYSAFGSYTGNGSADGPFVFTGFLPKFVMIKIASGGTANWLVQDSARDAYNPEVYLLNPNLSDAEATSSGYAVDFVANGFKLRNATTAWNYSGATFIYAAFASNPFQYSLAR